MKRVQLILLLTVKTFLLESSCCSAHNTVAVVNKCCPIGQAYISPTLKYCTPSEHDFLPKFKNESDNIIMESANYSVEIIVTNLSSTCTRSFDLDKPNDFYAVLPNGSLSLVEGTLSTTEYCVEDLLNEGSVVSNYVF